MVVWFAVLAMMGISWIVRLPEVLSAFDPRHAVSFFAANGFTGFAVLGAVFLVVTGGEALYADMGHFGKQPIRIAWYALVLPALVLNYLGQGALLLLDPRVDHPFFLLAPSWALIPLVVLSTAAAIIASQALISGSFSITRQAIQLGLAPRLEVEHTSVHEMGQIYVPQVNWALMCATVLIVIGFGSSTALAAAYGIAVTLTMIITVLLLYVVMTEVWHWRRPLAIAVVAVFPDHRRLVLRRERAEGDAGRLGHAGGCGRAVHVDDDVEDGAAAGGRAADGARDPARGVHRHGVRGTARTRAGDRGLHDRAADRHTAGARAQSSAQQGAARTRRRADRDHGAAAARRRQGSRLDRAMGHDLFNVRVQYGFMEDPDVPAALREACEKGLPIDTDDLTYFLGRETIIVTRRKGMAVWREKLFVLMARNAVRATAFFRLPPERVVELGVQVEM
jgi:KUP system potassium uptake protein